MNPANVKTSTYIDFEVESTDKNPKLKVGDLKRKPRHKNIFATSYAPNWSEEVFVIKKVKLFVPRSYLIEDRNGGELVESFYEK